MEKTEFRSNRGSSHSLYRIIVIGVLVFAFTYVSIELETSALSLLTYVLLLLLGWALLFPIMNARRPLYVIDERGIAQNKYWFLPRMIRWEQIRHISYPAPRRKGGRGAVAIWLRTGSCLTIGLSDIDRPFELLQTLQHDSSFEFDHHATQVHLERDFDRERVLYITLFYVLVGIAVLLCGVFYMPYTLLEDNRTSEFWAGAALLLLAGSIIAPVLVYKDVKKRQSFPKLIASLWLVVLVGPILVERNAYYNMRAMVAEKRNDHASAEAYVMHAIELHPEGYSYYETHGKALFGLGRYAESIDRFLFLLENDDRLTAYYRAYYHLWIGKAYVRMNEKEKAAEELHRVREYGIREFEAEVEALLNESRLAFR